MTPSPRLSALRHFAPPSAAPPCAIPPPFVGARHAAPAFSFAPTPTVSLSPLDATLTKKGGVPVDTEAVLFEP